MATDGADHPAARVDGDDEELSRLIARVREAAGEGQALRIVGGNTKAFYGRPLQGSELSVASYNGILSYEPTELVMTARAGTRLLDIEAALDTEGQMLGFEPPHFGAGSTLGGVVASGLSGPARPYLGAVRDHVLGMSIVNGHGQLLRFGGEVMKNVAGFDVSRLLAGSLGTLGLIVQVSVRVLPKPRHIVTASWTMPSAQARAYMLDLARAPWPITAMAFDGERLRVRFAGSEEAVADAVARLAPHASEEGGDYWRRLRDLELPFLAAAAGPLWRLSVPPAAPDASAAGDVLCDWGGAQRWVHGEETDLSLRRFASAHGGHATCVRAGADGTPQAFTEPAPVLKSLMQRLKQAFDPAGILNPGRCYAWL